jgi:hypothetical protein
MSCRIRLNEFTLATNNPALTAFFGLYPKIENRSSGLTGFWLVYNQKKQKI